LDVPLFRLLRGVSLEELESIELSGAHQALVEELLAEYGIVEDRLSSELLVVEDPSDAIYHADDFYEDEQDEQD